MMFTSPELNEMLMNLNWDGTERKSNKINNNLTESYDNNKDNFTPIKNYDKKSKNIENKNKSKQKTLKLEKVIKIYK